MDSIPPRAYFLVFAFLLSPSISPLQSQKNSETCNIVLDLLLIVFKSIYNKQVVK